MTKGIRAVTFVGDTMFVTGGFTGLRVLDATNARFPSEIGFFEVPHNSLCVAVDSQYAYVGDEGWLRVIDLEDPSSPRLIGSCNSSPGVSFDIVVQGTYAYAAGGTMMIFDVSDPTAPVLASEVLSPGASGIAMSGQLAYVADFSGLRVFDVSDPQNPTQVGGWSYSGSNSDVVVRDSIAYVVTYAEGLHIVSVSNPQNCVEIGQLETPGNAVNIALKDNFALIADEGFGLRIIDVSNPTTPIEVGVFSGCEFVENVYCSGNNVFITGAFCGLRVLDFNDPLNPSTMGYHSSPGPAIGITVVDN
ncbi:MAG: hypothetical protein IPG71_12620 [bacterium]|nr:hypothetical protein [bacterium]